MSEKSNSLSLEDDRVKRVLKMYEENPYINNFGFEVISVTDEFFKVSMPFNKRMVNPFGSLHGGALYSIADIIGGSLACFCGFFCTTTNGNLNYLEPAMNTDYIICEAKMIRSGKHLVVVNVSLFKDNGNLVAEGDFNFYRTSYAIR